MKHRNSPSEHARRALRRKAHRLVSWTALALALLGSGVANAEASVYWTLGVAGVTAGADGSLGVLLDGNGFEPSPAGTAWQPCQDGILWFHAAPDGTAYGDNERARMLSLATGAFLANKLIRTSVQRDASNRCFASYIWIRNR